MEEQSVKHSAPAFLEKLYEILEDPTLDDYIGWQPDGRSFLIKKVNELCELVLPKWFKHNNLQSFIRQLNMYSFSKTRHDSNFREFHQPLFQRGRRDLLPLIKRKVQLPSGSSAASAAALARANQEASGTKVGSMSFRMSTNSNNPHVVSTLDHIDSDDYANNGVDTLMQLVDVVGEVDQAQDTPEKSFTNKFSASPNSLPHQAEHGVAAGLGGMSDRSSTDSDGFSNNFTVLHAGEYREIVGKISFLEEKVQELTTVCSELSLKHNDLCGAIEKMLPAIGLDLDGHRSPYGTVANGTKTGELMREDEDHADARNNVASKDRSSSKFSRNIGLHSLSVEEKQKFMTAGDSGSKHALFQTDRASDAYDAGDSRNMAKSQTEKQSWSRFRSSSVCTTSNGDVKCLPIHPDGEGSEGDSEDESYLSTDSALSASSVTSADPVKRRTAGVSRDHLTTAENAEEVHETEEEGVLRMGKLTAGKKKIKHEGHGILREAQGTVSKTRIRRPKAKSFVPRSVPSMYDVMRILSDCRVRDGYNNSPSDKLSSTEASSRLSQPGATVVPFGSSSTHVVTPHSDLVLQGMGKIRLDNNDRAELKHSLDDPPGNLSSGRADAHRSERKGSSSTVRGYDTLSQGNLASHQVDGMRSERNGALTSAAASDLLSKGNMVSERISNKRSERESESHDALSAAIAMSNMYSSSK